MKVLIADDHPSYIEIFRDLVGSHCEVLIASTGLQALGTLRSTQIDLLITDYRMPFMNGLEIVQILASERIFRGQAILISSDLPEPNALKKVHDSAEGIFEFHSVHKDNEGFNFIKKIAGTPYLFRK